MKDLREDSPETLRTGKDVERQLVFLDFYNENDNGEFSYLATAIGDAVYKQTVNKYTYARIEKPVWQKYVRQSRLKDVDFFDREKIQNMGNALPADGILFGKFRVNKTEIRISAWILSVFSKEILAEVEVVVSKTEDLEKEIQKVSAILSRGLSEIFMPSDRGAIWRSALLPGWGQVYKGRRTAGHIYGGAVGTGVAFSLFSMIMWQNAVRRYQTYRPDYVITPQGGTELIDPSDAHAQFDRYAAQARTWETITLVSVGVTLTVYLWQILDAWLFDTRHAQLGKRLAAQPSETTFLILGGGNRSSYPENQVQNSEPGGLSVGVGLSF